MSKKYQTTYEDTSHSFVNSVRRWMEMTHPLEMVNLAKIELQNVGFVKL